MLFTFIAALAACQATAMRPELRRTKMSQKIATIGDVLSKISSPKDSGAALQEAAGIMDGILAETGNATEHMSDADEALLREVIELLETSIYSSMDSAHNADAQDLEDGKKAVEQCNVDIAHRLSADGDLGKLEQQVTEKQNELNRLQRVVDKKTLANATEWRVFDHHMQQIPAPAACPGLPQRTMPALDVFFKESEYVNWFTYQQEQYKAARMKWAIADKDLKKAIDRYNIQKAVRDTQYCDWKAELMAACAEFDLCYETRSNAYTKVLVPRVQKDMNLRIENFKAGQTIIHQIHFLLAEVAVQETPPIDTSRYELDFPILPPKGQCDLSVLDDPKWVPTPPCDDFTLPSVLRAIQYVGSLSPYLGYTGNLNVQGHVTVEGIGLLGSAAQVLSWSLTGVDPKCEIVPMGVKNACGVHIHEGESCSAPGGPHFWNREIEDEDPWLQVAYTTGPGNSAYASKVNVKTGLTNFDVLGRTIVVHDSTGARVACGHISPKRTEVRAWAPYVGYDGNLTISGSLDVTPSRDSSVIGQGVAWRLKGVDPNCGQGPGSAPNSCGVHIHEGISCSENALGHYWSKTTRDKDPWAHISYTTISDTGSALEGGVTVDAGFDAATLNGHTLIVHDYTGARVSCGIVQPRALLAKPFVPYFNYKGPLGVDGWVRVDSRGVAKTSSAVLSWSLKGVDPRCAKAPGKGANPNACGIHIHSGKSCNSDAGGHYYNTEAAASDPWVLVKYTAKQQHTESEDVHVATGYSNFDDMGRTIVVHDSTGARIACGILNLGAHSQ